MPSCVIFSAAVLLSACNAQSKKPDLVFDAGSLSDEQWERADKQCKFEAAKAVAPLKYGDITGDTFRRIYILCVETKRHQIFRPRRSDQEAGLMQSQGPIIDWLYFKRILCLVLFAFSSALVAGCTPGKPPADVFEVPRMSDAQWKRIRLECDYDAKKAVASQRPGLVRHLDWRELYLKCLELKGVKHIGTSNDFPDV